LHKSAQTHSLSCGYTLGREYVAYPLRCLAPLALLFLSGCGRVSVDLLPFGSSAACTVAGTAHPTDDLTCNGVDDDCDGAIDEDAAPRTSACGVGVCAATGTVTCAAGVEVDSCTALAPTLASDTTCNGVDEDCSGLSDEDVPVQPTSCGLGACASVGTLRCENARMVDSCTAVVQAPSDATCNGIDDDCNGTRDEDFVSMASVCGVGACAATGTISCVSGATSDSCRAGMAASSDASCDGVDQDCSGVVDEDYVPVATSCGLGVCRASGMLLCTGGAPRDTCTVGSPISAQDGPPSNGLDDDCDGRVDEDACVTPPASYGPGTHPNIALPAGCGTMTVQLWGGGGGAGGQTSVGTTGQPGAGGSGGYVQHVVTGSAVSLYVGRGGSGCGAGGVSAGSASYAGGAGAGQGGNGTPGADGMAAGGGAGATTGTGNGGRGHFGGGGGGSGTLTPWPPYPGLGGGGGAASVLFIAGARTAVAGGGGGGGGANGSSVASVGGSGGEGCGGAGGGANAGGGGGGGLCSGLTTTRGTNGIPANAGSIPAGRATGGTGDCGNGGDGYAIIRFGPVP
jgi:hypothetical protein